MHFNPVKPPKVACGDVLTKSVKLDADVICPDGTPRRGHDRRRSRRPRPQRPLDRERAHRRRRRRWRSRAPDPSRTSRSATARSAPATRRSRCRPRTASSRSSRSTATSARCGVTGDKNDFENIVADSSFHALDIEGNRLKFEGNTVTIHPNEQLGQHQWRRQRDRAQQLPQLWVLRAGGARGRTSSSSATRCCGVRVFVVGTGSRDRAQRGDPTRPTTGIGRRRPAGACDAQQRLEQRVQRHRARSSPAPTWPAISRMTTASGASKRRARHDRRRRQPRERQRRAGAVPERGLRALALL